MAWADVGLPLMPGAEKYFVDSDIHAIGGGSWEDSSTLRTVDPVGHDRPGARWLCEGIGPQTVTDAGCNLRQP
jgi:hypothetical protein